MLAIFHLRQLVNFWPLSLKKLYRMINSQLFKEIPLVLSHYFLPDVKNNNEFVFLCNLRLFNNGALIWLIWCVMIFFGAI